MNVTMFFHGGISYASPDWNDPRDGEQFASLAAAKRAFAYRAGNHDAYYPCVESPEAYLFIGAAGGDCPDYVLTLGPRGGVSCARA